MHIAELTIIYLAYGAPFGIYDLSCAARKPRAGELHLIVARFVFWPVLVASWMRRWFFRGQPRLLPELENEIEQLRERLEKLAVGDRSAAAILAFREVYARYTGLTLFLLARVNSQHRHPLYEFRYDPESTAAAACLYRRDREKVVFHQRQARAEFLDMVGQLSDGLPENDELILSSVEIAALLQDPECTNGLYSLLSDDRTPRIGNQLTFPKTAN